MRGAVVAAALILATSSCDSQDDQQQPPAEQPETATTASPGQTDVAVTEPLDPEPALRQALEAMGTRYEFESTVSVGEEPLTRVSGRIYDDASQFLVEAGGAEVEYVLSPEGQWVREPGGDWLELEESAPVEDPLAALAQPTSVELIQVGDDQAIIRATYPGPALGFSDTDRVEVQLVVTEGRIASLEYTADIGDKQATVVTVFTKAADAAPVTVPPTAGTS